MAIALRVDPFPPACELRALLRDTWGEEPSVDMDAVLARSLVHIGAFDGERLVGFVNVAWDGGVHASLFDTSVHPDYRRRGIATSLVGRATEVARERGAHWLHVDYEPGLTGFYRACGFRPTAAGLIRLC